MSDLAPSRPVAVRKADDPNAKKRRPGRPRYEAERAVVEAHYFGMPGFNRTELAQQLGVSRQFIINVCHELEDKPIDLDPDRRSKLTQAAQFIAERFAQLAVEKMQVASAGEVTMREISSELRAWMKVLGVDAPERRLVALTKGEERPLVIPPDDSDYEIVQEA